MESMNLSQPEAPKDVADSQIATRRYSSASANARELIRANAKSKAEEKLGAKMPESLNSPESELTRADWKASQGEALCAQACGAALR